MVTNVMSAKTDNYIQQYSKIAINDSLTSNIPPSIKLAQSILESGWGESELTVKANNFFGIKAGSSWKGEVYNIDTHEYYNSSTPVTVNADFRKYKNPKQSFKDHSKLLTENVRYSNLFALDFLDYKGWAKGLKDSGYATSPTYAEKLTNIIEVYNLDKFDSQAKKKRQLIVVGVVVGVVLMIFILVKLYKKYWL